MQCVAMVSVLLSLTRQKMVFFAAAYVGEVTPFLDAYFRGLPVHLCIIADKHTQALESDPFLRTGVLSVAKTLAIEEKCSCVGTNPFDSHCSNRGEILNE